MNDNQTDRPTAKRRTSNGLSRMARMGCVGMAVMSIAAAQAGAAIAVVGGVSNWVSSGANSLTQPYTVDPSAKVLVVQIALRNISTVPAFKWNGASMNGAASKINPDNPRVIATYYLFDPTPGTLNLTGTWSGGSISYSVGAFTLSGVDKNAAVLTGTYYAGPTTHNDATVTNTGVAANSAAVTEQISNSDCLTGGGTTQLTNFTQTATGGTPQSLWLTTTDGNNTGSAGALITGLSAGSVIVTGTILPTGGNNYVRTAFAATIFAPLPDPTPVIANTAVSNITVTTADLYGNLNSTGASATAVSVFWGKTDQYPSTNGWDGSYSFGYTNVGPLVTTASGLDSGTTYCFRYYATNTAGGVWADKTNFTTATPPSPPGVSNLIVTGIALYTATVIGQVTAGSPSPAAYICWGTNDAGTASTSDWTHVISLGNLGAGTWFTNVLTGLSSGQTHYYQCFVTNGAGGAWATGTVSFTTENMPFDSWAFKAQIKFTGYNKPESLTNFPVLVVLSNACFPGFAHNQFQSGSNDLGFTDSTGASSLNYEIESWNPNGSSYVWVQVPALVDTNSSIRVYWGSAGQSAPACTTNGSVWTHDYVGVWHMPNGTVLSLADSTTNRNVGSTTAVTATDGYVDGAGNFNGTASGYVNVGTNSSLNPAAVTVSAMVKFSSLPNGYNMLFAKDGGGWATGSYILPVKSNGKLAPYVDASANVSYDGSGAYTLTVGSWYYIAMTYSSSAGLKGFVNGLVDNSVAANGSLGTHNGAAWIGEDPSSTGRRVNGVIDEVRVSRVARSTNWVWAEYQTMASNTAFQTYGVATEGSSVPPTVANVAYSNVTLTTADLYGNLSSTGASQTAWGVLWGTNNPGATMNGWLGGDSTNLGVVTTPTTNAAVHVTGLQPNTQYYYSFWATNAAGTNVATPTAFTTLTAPAVSNLSATGIAPYTATVIGQVTAGSPSPAAYICWGTNDAGTASTSDWTHVISLGNLSSGTWFTNVLTGLSSGQTHYYQCFVTNGAGGAWAGNAVSFTTALTSFDPWEYKAQITFTGYNKPESLTNFPVLVVLSNNCFSRFAYDQFQSGSNDLGFTDSTGASNLNYEIESWNPNGSSYVWVQVPALADTNSSIWAYWGSAGQTAPVCTTNGSVWANGYVGVWHMAEAGTGTRYDSTSNKNDAVNTGATQAGGEVGYGVNKTASQYLTASNAVMNNWNELTWDVWFRTAQNEGNWERLLEKGANSEVVLDFSGSSAGCLVVQNGVNVVITDSVRTDDQNWHYAAVRLVAASGGKCDAYLYVDGAQRGSASGGTWTKNGTGSLNIGRYGGGGFAMNGYMDEARVSTVARSPNWIWATYMNISSNTSVFQTYGATTGGSGIPPLVTTLGPTNVATSGATVNGTLTDIGSAPVTAVSVYWGPVDGGTNAASWSNRTDLAGGSWTNGASLSTNLTMASGLDCYYTFAASNSAGLTLATGSKYFITGPLTVTATDASFGTDGADTATLVVSRPATCTGMAMTVYYSTSGDATSGVHYTASPASGALQIAAGATNATLTLTPVLPLGGTARTATVTLLGTDVYPVGSPASANATEQLGGVVSPAILWNDGDGNGGWINSAGWNNIQTAINSATNNPATAGFVKLCGDFIRASGDATVGSLVISNNNIALSGGWDTSFTTQSGRSMLNVNGSDTASNRFRVVDIWGTNVALANLVVTNGYMKNAFGNWVNNYGIGIFVRRPAVGTLLDNLVVAGNRGDTTSKSTAGGGIQIGEGGGYVGPSGTRVRNCQIVNNVVYGAGAGIYISDAGATDNPVVIENCTVANNIAYNSAESGYAYGGGIGLGDAISADANTASHVVIANCRIVRNQSATYGAGIGLQGWTAYPRVELFGCLIASNYWLTGASQKAGNAIAAGTPGGDGNWSSYTGFGGLTYLVNCTVVDNTQPSQPAAASGFHVNPSPYDEGRLILINSITRSNELGFTDVRYGGGDYNTHNYSDFQNDTVSEARYVEIDPQESNVTNTTFAGATSTNGNPTPAFRTLTTNGVLSQAIQQNIDGDPGFRGSGSDPYLLTSASANALDNAVTKTDSRGFGYVDVDLNGAYTTNADIIVAGTPPSGQHLVYTTDILGNPRVAAGGMDRGAYELLPTPKGTVFIFR